MCVLSFVSSRNGAKVAFEIILSINYSGFNANRTSFWKWFLNSYSIPLRCNIFKQKLIETNSIIPYPFVMIKLVCKFQKHLIAFVYIFFFIFHKFNFTDSSLAARFQAFYSKLSYAHITCQYAYAYNIILFIARA